MFTRRLVFLIVLACLPTTLTGCADVPQSPEARAEAQAVDDPLEAMNRVTFDVNDFLDRLLVRPLAELYRFALPDEVRNRIANILSNMGEPVVFANALMQGRMEAAETTAKRFLTNTTLGGAGMFDVASDWHMPAQQADFGQTLSSWGINGGPYLVLPLFGPSNFRDAIGLGVDMAMSPWQYITELGGNGTATRFAVSDFAADGLTRRDQNMDGYDALRSGSLDFYAEMRSVYRQYRDKQLGIQSSEPSFNDVE